MKTFLMTTLYILSGVLSVDIEPVPIFDRTPLNVTVIQGRTAILPCTIANRGKHRVIWMDPKVVLISTDDRRVIDDMRMSVERPYVQDWNLHIRNVQVEDDGKYTCQINTTPIQIKRVFLHVQVPPKIDNKTSSNDTSVQESDTVQLTCNASGVPKPTITWYRKTDEGQPKEPIGTVGEILLIHNISRYCGGEYECVADNGITEVDRRPIQVNVEFAPEVTLRTARLGQYRGKETILECIVSAFPQGVSQWMKRGSAITTEDTWKYRIDVYKENKNTMSVYLRILNIDEHDFGAYTCEAYNRLGKDRALMYLYEYHEPTTTIATTSTTRGQKPYINTILENNSRYNKGQLTYDRVNHRDYTTFNPSPSRNGAIGRTGFVGAGGLYSSNSDGVPVYTSFSNIFPTVAVIIFQVLYSCIQRQS